MYFLFSYVYIIGMSDNSGMMPKVKQMGKKVKMGAKWIGRKATEGVRWMGNKLWENKWTVLGVGLGAALGTALGSQEPDQGPVGRGRVEDWIARDLAGSQPRLEASDPPPTYSQIMRGGASKYPLASRPARQAPLSSQEKVMGQWLQAFTRPSN